MGRWLSLRRFLIAGAFLVVVTLLALSRASAAGSEFVGQEDDFVVTVDSRWAGCTQGGYHPIRIRVLNRGQTRDLQLVFQPQQKGLPRVSRTISVAQNATVMTSLLVPMVGYQNYGLFSVYERGQKLKQIETPVMLSEVETSGSRPALLVISPDTVDCTQFELMSSSIYGVSHARYGRATVENHAVIAPHMLPYTALSYSGLDVVAVARPIFESLRAEIREALLNWTQTGGALLIYNIGSNVTKDAAFAKLVGLDRAAQQTSWIAPDPQQRLAISLVRVDENGGQQSWTEPNPKFQFATEEGANGAKNYGLGRIIGVRDNPFPGTAHDWAWLIRSSLGEGIQWTKRTGLNARSENRDFMQFLIPGIQSVPTYSFLIFITLFAALIGPFNYYILVRRQRINWLIVTVPLLATLTTVCLFVYAALSHGFSVKSRVRSFTMLDQGLQTAVSTTRLALYAGMAPSDGMKFSTDTAVYPIWPTGNEFESGHVDWSETQHLSSGWLRSRTKTQFVTISHRAERGRLNVEPVANQQVRITNGFEWKIEHLLLTDDTKQASDSEHLYVGNEILAGTPATLARATTKDVSAFRSALSRAKPEFPEGFDQDRVFTSWGSSRYRHGYWNAQDSFSVAQGSMERRIQDLTSEKPIAPQLGPRSYLAIVKDAPSLDLGTKVEVVDGWHLIVGYY